MNNDLARPIGKRPKYAIEKFKIKMIWNILKTYTEHQRL